jgi:AhpD family alkylhydroperoxidase
MLNSANAQTTHLGEKVRQLISLAAALTPRWDGCIVVHADAGLKADASREEIAEALGLAVAVHAGARMVYSSRAMDAANKHLVTSGATSSGLVVVFLAEVGDQIFAHHPAQCVFQLHRLNEQVVLGVKLRAGHGRLEVEA